VLEIVCIMISKKEITSEDKQIIENALSLWVASVIRNENLIDDFYNYKRSDEKAGKNGIKNAEEFILAGIYCYKNYRVREEIANTLQIICSKVKNVINTHALYQSIESRKTPIVLYSQLIEE
jgi:hypothetical protein